MIPPGEAWEIVVENTEPLPPFEQGLSRSLGYVLTEPVRADRDIPPADRAVMDGYAVRAEDVQYAPVTLHVCGEAAAGSESSPVMGTGGCVRIFTGANVPPEADAVVMVEDTTPGGSGTGEEDAVTFLKPASRGSHIFRRGESARLGEELIPAGTVIGPAHIGVCAAVGRTTVNVHRRPAVSVLTTGEELLDMGDEAGPHQTRDSNGPMIVAALESRAYEVSSVDSAPDDIDRIAGRIRAALGRSDAVLVTGGVSVGKYDFVPEAVSRAGGTVRLHGIAMKPGKPQLFATAPGGKFIFGLPGNPLSVMNGLHEFVLPALRRLGGVPPEDCRPYLRVRLAQDVPSMKDRQRCVLGRLAWKESGPVAEVVEDRGSADIVASGKADGTIIVPVNAGKLEAGSLAYFRVWRALP